MQLWYSGNSVLGPIGYLDTYTCPVDIHMCPWLEAGVADRIKEGKESKTLCLSMKCPVPCFDLGIHDLMVLSCIFKWYAEATCDNL